MEPVTAASGTTTSALIHRHHRFYYQDGSHVFLVENTLFKPHGGVLSEWSSVFRGMFSIESNGKSSVLVLDGTSDANPIILEQQTADAFELFLSVCYGSWKPDSDKASDTAYINVLRLSDKYMSQKARDWALCRIHERRFSLKTPQLISIALGCNVKQLLPLALHRLVSLRFNDISADVRRTIGPVVWDAVVNTKELLDEHCKIVACEAPVIQNHWPSCQNATKCSEDWHQIWWNGMGRFLLDGRNPQPYKDAVQRFENLVFEIGEMNPECWRGMLEVVKGESAFDLAYDLVEQTALRLEAALIVEPSYDSDGSDDSLS